MILVRYLEPDWYPSIRRRRKTSGKLAPCSFDYPGLVDNWGHSPGLRADKCVLRRR